MGFLNTLEKNTNKSTYTENGALTNASSLDVVLDYFAMAGAMRTRPEEAVKLFQKAYNVNPLMAVRCLFYLRDVRGGAGERDIFRRTLNAMDSDLLSKVIEYVGEFGRYDDIPVNGTTADFLYQQFLLDEANMRDGKSVSLLAKWLPSENTSSATTVEKAKFLIDSWGLSHKQYRKRVSALRKYIKILEQKMSANEWDEIEFGKIPSQAHRKHIKAFFKHDKERYLKYLEDVKTGKEKINSGTLFTYEIYDELRKGYHDKHVLDAMTEMWKALPDYTNGTNALVMADVSGSMCGRPMSVSTTLAVYFAERNKGPFANKYMTFTDIPQLVTVQGSNLWDKINYVERSHVGYNTNLAAAFDAILKAAVQSKATQEELPSVLYVISDMEFDCCRADETNFETAQRKFSEAGYELPHVVFWNVNSRNNQQPATKFDDRVTLISGSNQSAFKYAVEGKNPLELMEDVLNGDRYSKIVI